MPTDVQHDMEACANSHGSVGQADRRPVAVVLGAAVWEGGTPSPTLRRRCGRAVALWQGGGVRALVACGGTGRFGPSEAEVMRDLWLAAGVPAHVIHCEDQSRTTEENIRNARPVLTALGADRIILVSDAYHLPRAALVAKRQGWRAGWAATPVRGAHLPTVARAALREVPGLFFYWIKGKGR